MVLSAIMCLDFLSYKDSIYFRTWNHVAFGIKAIHEGIDPKILSKTIVVLKKTIIFGSIT